MPTQQWKTLKYFKEVQNRVCVTNPAARFGGPASYWYILNMFYIDIDQKSIYNTIIYSFIAQV